MPAIEIDNLVRRYGRTDAVNGLNLRVEAGRCYGFFGRNGAGKTITIKCLLMRAVVLALPVILGLLVFVDQGARVISRALDSVPMDSLAATLRPWLPLTSDAVTWLLVCVVVDWIALLQWFGFQNHRSAERSAARVWRQVGWIATFVVVSIILFHGLGTAVRAAWVTPPR